MANVTGLGATGWQPPIPGTSSEGSTAQMNGHNLGTDLPTVNNHKDRPHDYYSPTLADRLICPVTTGANYFCRAVLSTKAIANTAGLLVGGVVGTATGALVISPLAGAVKLANLLCGFNAFDYSAVLSFGASKGHVQGAALLGIAGSLAGLLAGLGIGLTTSAYGVLRGSYDGIYGVTDRLQQEHKTVAEHYEWLSQLQMYTYRERLLSESVQSITKTGQQSINRADKYLAEKQGVSLGDESRKSHTEEPQDNEVIPMNPKQVNAEMEKLIQGIEDILAKLSTYDLDEKGRYFISHFEFLLDISQKWQAHLQENFRSPLRKHSTIALIGWHCLYYIASGTEPDRAGHPWKENPYFYDYYPCLCDHSA